MSVGGMMITRLIDALEKEGKRILSECEAERTYQHRTLNLFDSYGFGVYYKGKLERKGFLTSSPESSETKYWYGKNVEGREQIENFLNREYKPSKGIDLVIAAAMPYAHALENASSGQHQRYRVVSMSYNKLMELQKQAKGSIVNIISASRVQ